MTAIPCIVCVLYRIESSFERETEPKMNPAASEHAKNTAIAHQLTSDAILAISAKNITKLAKQKNLAAFDAMIFLLLCAKTKHPIRPHTDT